MSSDDRPRYVVQWTRTPRGTFLLVKQEWVGEKRHVSPWWTPRAEDATAFLSEEDAWLAFDRLTAPREDYTVRLLAEAMADE